MLRDWLANEAIAHLLPEVTALQGVPQTKEFHPEGDAYIHTMLAVEVVEDLADQRVFWAVLLHDIGKAHTTFFSEGRWRAHGHADAGAERVPAIMNRLGFPELADDVAWLVKNHQYHLSWQIRKGEQLTRRQKRFTEHPLFYLLEKVCAADLMGRGSSRIDNIRTQINN
jgi:putative nucleotidyltransferase with HDIG domain